ncbi:MAG: hypothetical protein Q7S27_02995 [Nanoarchaeota archaeon]|nr:hypothetical protein [Nanoarchaeota archaeon]
MKVLIFDAGPIINFSINGMLDVLESLKNNFKGKFIITEAVKKEVIDYPLNVPRFELGALRVQALLNKGVLELPSSLNIDNEIIKKESLRLMNIANHYVSSKGTWINILSEGETSCLALSSELTKQNIENIIAIDERTTRILAEKPQNLQKIISDRLHSNVKAQLSNLEEFYNFKFIRSTELVYIAFKKGLLNIQGKKALEAALYATKFKGSSVTFEEIEELKKLN